MSDPRLPPSDERSGEPGRPPPPMVLWVFVVLGLLMLAAVGWGVFGSG